MSVSIRLSARCEAAGRPNNEDDYQIAENLAEGKWGFVSDKIVHLGSKGALLIVCDGMGGMNAGEVASDIAVKTIQQWFAPERLTANVMANDVTRCEHIRAAIKAADAAIKAEGNRDTAKRGMGSTAVMAWLLGEKVYVGWCGDSRAYKFNPQTGLNQMSHDHSYVQELVDSGQLSEDLAFDHPNNNIITRSLGDPRGEAQPDTAVFDLCENDIILLCSDGLSGSLRKHDIESIIRLNTASMTALRDALWDVSRPHWHDNVTTVLAQVMPSGNAEQIFAQHNTNMEVNAFPTNNGISETRVHTTNNRRPLIIFLVCLSLVAGCGLGYYFWQKYSKSVESKVTALKEKKEKIESTRIKLDAYLTKESDAADVIINYLDSINTSYTHLYSQSKALESLIGQVPPSALDSLLELDSLYLISLCNIQPYKTKIEKRADELSDMLEDDFGSLKDITREDSLLIQKKIGELKGNLEKEPQEILNDNLQ